MKFVVAFPSTWIFVPLDPDVFCPVEELWDPFVPEPIEFDGDWGQIIDVVTAAVSKAREIEPDLFARSVEVEVDMPDGFTEEQIDLAADWLHYFVPQVDPLNESMADGGSQIWLATGSGRLLAPARETYALRAVTLWHGPSETEGPVAELDLRYWNEDLAWWKSPDAQAWAALNPSFSDRMREVIERWTPRMAKELAHRAHYGISDDDGIFEDER